MSIAERNRIKVLEDKFVRMENMLKLFEKLVEEFSNRLEVLEKKKKVKSEG